MSRSRLNLKLKRQRQRYRLRRAKMKGPQDYESFIRGCDNMNFKEENQLLDLEDKSKPLPEVNSGFKADRAAKHD